MKKYAFFSQQWFILSLLLMSPVALWAQSDSSGLYQTERVRFRLDTVVTGITIPWGMTWLPDGRMLVAERSGQLYLHQEGQPLDTVAGVPEVYLKNQAGLFDLELHPDYDQNGWIYFTYSTTYGAPKEEGGATVLARARLEEKQLVDQEILFESKPKTDNGVHFGGRIEFDNEGYVFFSVGEGGDQENAQKLDNSRGKIFRLHDDGRVPEDNPFVDSAGAIGAIWSYGNRNPQGLALHPTTGELWAHEHGPQGGDEINIIQKGANYGWPRVTYGIDYDGTIISDDTALEGMQSPYFYWLPSIAPCGMDFVTGDQFPAWRGDLLVGSLKFQYLERLDLEGSRIIHREKLLEGVGRVRNVRQGPDGYIYLALEGKGIIVKLVPESDIN